MPHEAVTTTLYTIAATAKGGRDGTVSSEDGVIDLPLGKPGSRSNHEAQGSPSSRCSASPGGTTTRSLMGPAERVRGAAAGSVTVT